MYPTKRNPIFFKSFFGLLMTMSVSIASMQAQASDYDKLENQKYYQSFIKDNISYMREYVDSNNIKLMLNSMEQINDKIAGELEKIKVEVPTVDTMSSEEKMSDEIEISEEDVTLGGGNDDKIEDLFKMPEADDDNISPLNKFIPGRKSDKKVKTSFIINYGLNMLQGQEGAGIRPEINRGSSWFWEYGLQNRVKIGNSKKVYFTYGLSYLKNRFSWENSILLKDVIDTNGDHTPNFTKVENLKGDAKMRLGYVTLPLGFRLKVAKKTYFDLGGYVGYNVLTSQTHVFKVAGEKITEKRNGDYGVNDWTYGATAGIKLFSTRFVFKYNLAPVFADNASYNTSLWMIGLQSEL
jgi:hypothetical protein